MSAECEALHALFGNLTRHRFSIDEVKVPLNGVYVLFEEGEMGHSCDRIVRVGTHTGNNQLRSRLRQHFQKQNKDRSIFRKNIGRALLNKNDDAYRELWELDLTTRKARAMYLPLIDADYQQEIEEKISEIIQNKFSFSVIEIVEKSERLETESKIISTVSLCEDCRPSGDWLGNYSPKNRIVESGLWLVNELYKTPLRSFEIEKIINSLNK